MRFSRRSSDQATDLSSRRASHVMITNSGQSDTFCPKPPPTSGAITRRSDSRIPMSSAMMVRIACGIWVAQVSATRPLPRSHAACAARVSSGSAFWRPERIAISTRRCARAMAASNPGVCRRASTMTLRAASACTQGAPVSIASRAPTTAGISSISSSTRSAKSSASCGLSAITAATGSPTNRTVSFANTRWPIGT